MSPTLVLLPLVAALYALFAPSSDSKDTPPARETLRGGAALLLALVAVAGAESTLKWDLRPLLFGAAALALLAASQLRLRNRGTLALAMVAAGIPSFAPAEIQLNAQLATMTVVGLAAIAFRTFEASAFAAAAATALAGSYLGGSHLEHTSGPAVAATVLLFAALPVAILPKKPALSPLLESAIAGLLAVGGAAYAGLSVVHEPNIPVAVLAGAVAAWIVGWLLSESEESDGLRISLSALIWLGVATLTFGMLRGFGMSLALLGAIATLVPTRNPRVLLTLGPLAGLVIYRLLRDARPEASRALDIGQHYALVGLAVGMLIATLPADAIRRQRGAVGSFLWALLMLVAPVLAHLIFGGIGAVGFIVGAGLSGLVYAYRRGEEATAIAVGIGLGAETVLLAGTLGDLTGLTRDEKIRVIGFAAIGIAIIAAGLTVLGRKAKEVTA